MSDPMPPEPIVELRKSKWLPRMSLVWIVPLLALAISLTVAWRSYSERGPIIEIVFDSASGITAGETTVRFRDFVIGSVESLGLTDDLRQVVATVRLDREAADYVDADARFWLVRAQVGPRGISGLDTVLSGAFIEASFDAEPGTWQPRHVALAEPPLTPLGEPGLRIRLRAPDGGSLAVGAPILFKQIAVGRIEDIEITPAGEVLMTAFVNAPHHERLTTATRFWNASGIALEVAATGVSLRVDSLASLFEGGLAFDTVTSGGEPVEVNHTFDLFASESVARTTLLSEDESAFPVTLQTVFDGSLRGLRVGAEVEYRGIRVGEVTGIQARVVEGATGPRIELIATLQVLPNRLGIPDEGDPVAATLDLLENAVARGLRAQLRAAGLLNPALFVSLAELPEAPPASFDRDAEPHPLVPSVLAEEADLMASASGIIDRVQALPIEAVVDQAIAVLASVNALLGDERLRAAPENLGLLLADLREIVQDSGLRETPGEINLVLASVRALVEEAAEQEFAVQLTATIAEARIALATVNEALPGLLDDIDSITLGLDQLPLEDVVIAARQLVENVDLLVQESIAPLPREITAAVDEIRLLLADLRTSGVTENAGAAVASLRQIADELAAAGIAAETTAAVQGVSAASAELPALVASLTALTDEAAALPLDTLLAEATELVASIDALVTSDGVAGAPAEIEAALREARAILAELRAGDTPANINATLASVRQLADELAAAELAESIATVTREASLAAGNISSASEELPALVASLTDLSDRAAELPLEDLVASGTRTLDGIEAVLAAEGVEDVPPRLAGALAELEAILAELRDGGAVANVNATLASADAAAEAVTAAAQDLPALVAQLSQTAARADAALATVGPGSDINRDTVLLLREVRDTARAVNALVTALERRPNSLLFGR